MITIKEDIELPTVIYPCDAPSPERRPYDIQKIIGEIRDKDTIAMSIPSWLMAHVPVDSEKTRSAFMEISLPETFQVGDRPPVRLGYVYTENPSKDYARGIMDILFSPETPTYPVPVGLTIGIIRNREKFIALVQG